MTKSLKLIAAAVLLSSAAIGGAMAQQAPSNQGDYYQGADRNPTTSGAIRSGGAVPIIIPGGEGAYYDGVDRMPQVDRMSTGSISNSTDRVPLAGGDGEYYEGINRPATK